MGQGAQGAGTAMGAVGSAAGSMAAIGTAAAAVQAVPIAGQVIGAAMAVGMVLAKVFGARKDKKKEKKKAQQAFIKRHQQRVSGGVQQAQARPTQAAPETQGMGQFQQMQAGEGPIYQSGGGQPQQNTGVNYG